jgi:5'-3' exoribonuclease 2
MPVSIAPGNPILGILKNDLDFTGDGLSISQLDNSMKSLLLTLISAVASLALSNCTAPAGRNTQNGAVAGGLLGAAAGGIIGHQSGHTAEGALLGAAAGGATGAVIGNNQDAQEYRRY